jgi:hypothetical protein
LPGARSADLALLDKLRHGAHGVFDGDLWVDAMQIVKIDILGSQPSQRILTGPGYVLRLAFHLSSFGPRLAAQIAELGGEHDRAAPAL